ncbi:MAG TPA: NAD(P)-dependent oxidoreductase [Xanthobacteraceae bacterium]|nr:NAD(P)-dependent oxidoreductase [Xanthobacteraceae bacterium]
MTERHVGFIGVGRMGNHMAGRLVEAGYRVTVYDTNETAMARLVQRGAERAESAAAVASAAETVLVSLPTPDIVRAVALGPAGVAAGTKVKTFVDLSTTGPRVAAAVAEGLAAKGIVAVDAPVSGGPSGAEKGTLAVMVACPRPLAEQLRPVIQVIGKYFYIGEKPGMGQTMKVINNLMSAAAQAITAEAMVMGAKAGLDAQTMVDVINSGSGRNTATEDKFPRCVLPRRFDFGFTLELLCKDVRLCLEEAEALGVPMLVGNAVRQLLAVAKASEGEASDITTMVRPIERWAGVEVTARAGAAQDARRGTAQR